MPTPIAASMTKPSRSPGKIRRQYATFEAGGLQAGVLTPREFIERCTRMGLASCERHRFSRIMPAVTRPTATIRLKLADSRNTNTPNRNASTDSRPSTKI
jgi:hypothetical protein